MIQAGFNNWAEIQTFLTKKIQHCRVMVIGDIMLDRYFFGEVKRISPEAPVPVALVKEVKETLGGAANVSHNLARLGCKVYLAGLTGNDFLRTTMVNLLGAQGIGEDGLIMAQDRPTISKTRVIGGHQQILRLDFEDSTPLTRKIEQQLMAYINKMAAEVDSIIISDYAKGVCTPKLCQTVIREGLRRNIPVIVDPKGSDWRKYKGAFMITPNLKELGEAVRKSVANEDLAIEKAAQLLRIRYQLTNLVVTRSERGMSLIDQNQSVHIPTTAQEVFDVSGAGDTVISVLGTALAGKVNLADAAQLANLAAGVVVGKLGTYAISRDELMEAVGHSASNLRIAAATSNPDAMGSE